MHSNDLAQVRRTLWKAADELRANSTLAPSEARGPILGLIFLAYAEHRFESVRAELEAKATARRPVTPDDYRARSVLFVSEEARLSYLVRLPEDEDLGAALDTAMRLMETHNPELKGVLPRGYQRLQKSTLTEMLRLFAPLRLGVPPHVVRAQSSVMVAVRHSVMRHEFRSRQRQPWHGVR